MAVFMRSGRSSLDLVWTVRFRSVWPTETLTDPASLSMWLRGTYPHVDVKPELCTTEFLAEIKDLRENVYSLVRAEIAQEPLHTDGRSALNHLADGPRFRHQVTSERVAHTAHFFWGSFDLAVTRFSGRDAPPHPGGIPNFADDVAREAYSQEVTSLGFWPGNAENPEPIFYA